MNDINQSLGQASPTQLAGLDLGSNSFHLLIAQQSHGRIQVLDKHKEMVRLAAGLDEDNTLSPEVTKRALDCLSRLSQRLRTVDPQNLRIVGTNTLRLASNAKAFIKQAEQILDHKIEIISGHEEARLIFLGVCHDLGGDDQKRLVIDIGGGSTELILGKNATPQILESLHMGCVSMSQKYFVNGDISKARFDAAVQNALIELEPVTAKFLEAGWHAAVGASGTVNAVMSVIRQKLDHELITADALLSLREEVLATDNLKNLSIPGLSDERKPVFAGGLAVLLAIFEALQIDKMTAAQSALREGLIYDLLGRDHQENVREQTVQSLTERYRIDQSHARSVRETAIGLHAQVARDWQLTHPQHKRLLSWAASLHEIGMDISHSGFHKHGCYLLENMDMPGFSQSDQQQLATLVRTHRRKLSHELFSEVDASLIKLAALLRLSILLHRNRSKVALPHVQAVIADAGDSLELTLPQQWLHTHPLTKLDLANEARYLANVSIGLMVIAGGE